jgi:exodeoxyribonuclease V alpha subunit
MIQRNDTPRRQTHHSPSTRISISGHLEHIAFRNSENHYTVARIRADNTGSIVTVVGYLPGARPGEAIQVTGGWETHPRFGEQFHADHFEILLPEAVEGIRKYLGSGFIKGVGSKMVARIVDRFGKETLDIIENDPQRLTEVPGVGKKTAHRIGDAWRRHHTVRSLMRFLQENDLPTSHCGRILKLYGDEAVDVLNNTPYRIALDWPGTGFKIADTIAVQRGMAKDDPDRVKACLLHLVSADAEDGHTLAEAENLSRRCISAFDVPSDSVDDALAQLCDDGQLVSEPDLIPDGRRAIYLKPIHRAETGITRKLGALCSVPMPPAVMDRDQITAEIVRKLAIQLSDEQREILEALLNHRVAVLTGGPGTGKTTLIRALNAVNEAQGRRILLAAPTGRAAKRLSEVSGQPAATIHRLLRYNVQTGLFDKNRDDPLETDVVIIDEASMVDTLLMYHLLEAIHLQAVVVFVGDVFQLPPVGPGNVLADLIDSGIIATFELTRIFRQARKSPIITNAHRIRMGNPPDLSPPGEIDELKEFYFIEMTNPAAAVSTIGQLCADRIPRRFYLDPIRDIQVITPMHKGDVGTINLNRVLQKLLNPQGTRSMVAAGTFRVGDKVMHLKNNYAKDVFNGDIGTVAAIEKKGGGVAVDYDGRQVDYDTAELDELTLAYAISVHKSQGSEYPAVILPLLTQHYILLQRNLLYTAITRGKQLVVIVGSTRAVEIALANDTPQRRLSGLSRRLKRLG